MNISDIGPSSHEAWGWTIALATIALIYIIQDMLREDARVQGRFHWGDKQRRASVNEATWARHELCFAAMALGVAVAIQALWQ